MQGQEVTDTPIATDLFREEPDPVLIGGRHRETGRIVFPCPNDPEQWEQVDLPRRGTLWSWTVQRFRPKSPPYTGPEEFEPFAIGYIELPGATIVESRIADAPFEDLRIGMPMELAVVPFTTDVDGNPVKIFAFSPASGT